MVTMGLQSGSAWCHGSCSSVTAGVHGKAWGQPPQGVSNMWAGTEGSSSPSRGPEPSSPQGPQMWAADFPNHSYKQLVPKLRSFNGQMRTAFCPELQVHCSTYSTGKESTLPGRRFFCSPAGPAHVHLSMSRAVRE